MRLVRGIGVYEKGKHTSQVAHTPTKVYTLWTDMLRRCYSEKYQLKKPSYKGCSVSENFKNFQYFAEWCVSQVGFDSKNWQLDKDLLLKGNKVYSEDTCVFVPREINSLLLDNPSRRGGHLRGVRFNNSHGGFSAAMGVAGKSKHLGYYKTQEEAFTVYKQSKESYVKQMAEKYRSVIDMRVYKALLEWKVPTK